MSLPTTSDISGLDIVTPRAPWINQVAKSAIDTDNTIAPGFPLYFAGTVAITPPTYNATSFMIMF